MIKYLTTALKMLQEPGMIFLMRDWSVSIRTHFLYAAIETELLTALVSGATKDALIEKLGVQRVEVLEALLDVGLALKEIRRKNGVYHLRGRRSKALIGRQSEAMTAVVQAAMTYYHGAYRNLAERLKGAALGDDLSEIGDIVARFSKLGELFLSVFLHSIIPSKGDFRILDVGCGSGFVLHTASQVNDVVSGIGMDIDPQVVKLARRNLVGWGLEKRFDILAGDIRSLELTKSGHFDLITAFNIIYYFPDEKRIDLFSRMSGLLKPHGRLALVNNFQSKGRDVIGANLNVVNTSLEHLTPLPDLEITKKQLTDSGFSSIKTHRFLPGSWMVGYPGATATIF